MRRVKQKYNIEIFGFGNRVKNDLIPVIEKIFIDFSLELYASCKRIINLNGSLVHLQPFNDYKKKKIINKDKIAFISVPITEQEVVLNEVLKKKDQYFRIFLDTPMLHDNYKHNNKLDILEDYSLSPLVDIIKSYKETINPNLFFYYKCLYKYHGISLLKIFDENINFKKSISIELFLIKITFFKGEKNHIVISPRNYKSGSILLFKTFIKSIFFKKIKVEGLNIIINRSPIHKIQPIQKFLLDDGEYHFFNIIDSIKRIGLSNLISNSILDDKIQYPPKEAAEDMYHSKKI